MAEQAKKVEERYDHDVCPKCGTASIPSEGVSDQALRGCPKCGHQWFEDLTRAPKTKPDPTHTIWLFHFKDGRAEDIDHSPRSYKEAEDLIEKKYKKLYGKIGELKIVENEDEEE